MVRLSKKHAEMEARIEAKVMLRLQQMKHPLVVPAVADPALPPVAALPAAVEDIAAQPEMDGMQLLDAESLQDETYFKEFGILRRLRLVANR